MNTLIEFLTTDNKYKAKTKKKCNPFNYTSAVELYKPFEIVRSENVDDYVKNLGL